MLKVPKSARSRSRSPRSELESIDEEEPVLTKVGSIDPDTHHPTLRAPIDLPPAPRRQLRKQYRKFPILRSSGSQTSMASIDSGLGRASGNEDYGTNMDAMSTQNCTILTAKTSFNDKIRVPVSTVCLVGECAGMQHLHDLLAEMRLTVVTSETGREFVDKEDTGFVLDRFEGAVFHQLCDAKRTVYGPTAIKEFAATKELYRTRRPLFCRSMEGIVVVFSGFRKNKHILEELLNLVHFMGGSVRQNYVAKVTHVVSSTTQSEKYRLAVAAGIPVMSEEWVRKAWEKRSIVNSHAFSDEMKRYKLPALFGLKLAFHGLPLEDLITMETRTAELGGEVVEPSQCTHYVISTETVSGDGTDFPKPNPSCRMVSAEWFWTSAHLEICANETEYPAFGKMNDGLLSPSASETFKSVSGAQWSRPSMRRRSSSSSAMNGPSHFDASNDASCMLDDHMFSVDDLESFMKSPTKTGVSKRQMACAELLATESNYLKYLNIIITVFKEPCERADPFGNRLLEPMEVKTIFNNVVDIKLLHEKIRSELTALIANWNEKNCIGRVYLHHKDELMKLYAPYMNFHPTADATLNACIKRKQRFSAYLECCRKKPECEKKVLKDLLICPVQRLASVVLLFAEIRRRTDKSHDDYNYLQQAIDALNEVLTHLNEDRRKTETYTEMFDIVKEIEDCPAHLLSSQRQLIAEIDVADLSAAFCKKKNSVLTFYLFNDCIEIAKKTSKSGSRLKKHKELIPLPRIRRVVNVGCSDDSTLNLFCLTVRDNLSDTDFTFSFLGSSSRRDSFGSSNSLDAKSRKREFLDTLCTFIVTATGRTGFCCEDHDANAPDDTPLGTTIKKAVRRVKAEDGSLKRTLSVRTMGRSSGQFRRSISHAMMNFASGTLRRMSRSNLRMPLHEIVEEAAANLSKSKNDSSLMIGN